MTSTLRFSRVPTAVFLVVLECGSLAAFLVHRRHLASSAIPLLQPDWFSSPCMCRALSHPFLMLARTCILATRAHVSLPGERVRAWTCTGRSTQSDESIKMVMPVRLQGASLRNSNGWCLVGTCDTGTDLRCAYKIMHPDQKTFFV